MATPPRQCSECGAVDGTIVKRVIGNQRKWVALTVHALGSQMYTPSVVVSVTGPLMLCQACEKLPRLDANELGGGWW